MRLLALPLALALLSGCGGDPAGALRDDVAALTEAANARGRRPGPGPRRRAAVDRGRAP
jgi:hypothetical protein